MTTNMQYIVDSTTAMVNRKYGDTLPTLEQINAEAEIIRNAFSSVYPVTDDEFEQVKKTLATDILHTIGFAITLRGRDAEHQSWYYVQENDGYFWNRYRTYLKNIKHWGIEVVNRLNKTTDDIMDDLGNPNDHSRPFQRRGLLLGDVQSGKTATYTAICNKSADAGYRVIIVLAGMMENLRVQTQERLDAEFVGIESKYALDKKAGQEIRNTPVGVGKIPPVNQNKRIACFTSVATDFNKTTLRALGLSLRNLNGTALFVVKKNKSVLNNLYKWLMENNADYENGMIDLPLLLIDDEADNASVNTNSEEKDPTAINQATDAVNELKDELLKMKRQNQTPEEFGLKVRQAPGALLITAKNKMRTATSVSQPITVSGRMIETPRLRGDAQSIGENERLCLNFLQSIAADPSVSPEVKDEYTKAYIWKDVPKRYVTDLVRNFITHPWNLNFQPTALSDYISEDIGGLDLWDVAIPNGSEKGWEQPIDLFDHTIWITPEGRQIEWDAATKNLLRVNGHHVRVGVGGCSKIGLDEKTIKRIREEAKTAKEKITDRTYLIKDRKPLLLIHILHNTTGEPERKEGDPEILYALGLGFPNDGQTRMANYMVNITELKNWVDITDEDDDDDANGIN